VTYGLLDTPCLHGYISGDGLDVLQEVVFFYSFVAFYFSCLVSPTLKVKFHACRRWLTKAFKEDPMCINKKIITIIRQNQ
jgi:hypothetical protein